MVHCLRTGEERRWDVHIACSTLSQLECGTTDDSQFVFRVVSHRTDYILDTFLDSIRFTIQVRRIAAKWDKVNGEQSIERHGQADLVISTPRDPAGLIGAKRA